MVDDHCLTPYLELLYWESQTLTGWQMRHSDSVNMIGGNKDEVRKRHLTSFRPWYVVVENIVPV